MLTFDWHKPVPGPRTDKLFIFNQRRGVLLRLHKIKFRDPRDLFCFRFCMFKKNFSLCFKMKNEHLLCSHLLVLHIIVVQNVQFIPIYNNTLARLMVFMVIENFWSIASFPSLSLAFNVFSRLAPRIKI